VVFAFALVLPLQAQRSPEAISAEIEPILRDLSRISGMPYQTSVPFETLSKDQLRKYLQERIRTTVKPEQLRAEQLTLKKFGLVPQDFDLEKTTIDLMTEQAAAFYDDERRKMFLIEGAPSLMEQVALVHELAHALADQHYSLGKFVDREKQSDDAQMARMAVVEGQAMWLMLEYSMQKVGQSLLRNTGLLDMMAKQAESSQGQYPVFDKAPLYLRETLLFPYSAGLKFQQQLIQRSGQAGFREVFRQPPASTQQVLHVEQYLAKTKPSSPALPAFSSSGYKEVTAGTMGELDHYILLKQYSKETDPSQLAAHIKGGMFQLLEEKKGDRLVLRYASEWDSPVQAEKFYQQYLNVLKGKWKQYAAEHNEQGRLVGKGDDGYFVLQLSGSTVTSLEGLSAAPAEEKAAIN
jgi:hypothetical protein